MMRVLTLRRRSGERDVPTILVRSDSWSVRRALKSCDGRQGLQLDLNSILTYKEHGRAVYAHAEMPFQSLDDSVLLNNMARLFTKHQ